VKRDAPLEAVFGNGGEGGSEFELVFRNDGTVGLVTGSSSHDQLGDWDEISDRKARVFVLIAETDSGLVRWPSDSQPR
jgi:hypothetical protein